MKTGKYQRDLAMQPGGKKTVLPSGRLYVALFLLLLSGGAYSDEARFECSIHSVLALSDNGRIVTHGWSANYLNRKFTVDRGSGKVISTTALKVRLSNYDKESQPLLLDRESYRAITIFENKDSYSALEIEKRPDDEPMPFFYKTNIGMMLSGTCQLL